MSLFNLLRKQVSGDKHRLTHLDYDIDMTYITPRIIAMSFPADGVEKAYRNSIDDVVKVLEDKHPEAYRIYNLSQRKYDYAKFNGRVIDWCGWPDHHAPPTVVLFRVVDDIHQFLMEDERHVVVVHCLAGKGRTGTVIASYLLYAGLFNHEEEAREYFAKKRSANNWGVSGPSQIRSVEWFDEIMKEKFIPVKKLMNFKKIVFNHAPSFRVFTTRSGFMPIITIHDFNSIEAKPDCLWHAKAEFFNADTDVIEIEFESVFVHGDLLVIVEMPNFIGKDEVICRFSLHTDMIDDTGSVVFQKHEIDDTSNDKRFPSDFNVEFIFEPQEMTEELEYLIDHDLDNFTRELLETMFKDSENLHGETCFFKTETSIAEIIEKERDFIQIESIEKGGYLTKEGQNVKSWKRRWFVIRDDKLEYFSKPNSTSPLGTIELNSIRDVTVMENSSHPKNTFKIKTLDTSYYVYADDKDSMKDWVIAIETARSVYYFEKEQSLIGKLIVSPIGWNLESPISSTYCVLEVGSTKISSAVITESTSPKYPPDSDFIFHIREPLPLRIQVFSVSTFMNSQIGEATIQYNTYSEDTDKETRELSLFKNSMFKNHYVGDITISTKFVLQCDLSRDSSDD